MRISVDAELSDSQVVLQLNSLIALLKNETFSDVCCITTVEAQFYLKCPNTNGILVGVDNLTDDNALLVRDWLRDSVISE